MTRGTIIMPQFIKNGRPGVETAGDSENGQII